MPPGWIRKLSRQAGFGVVDALQARPTGEEPGWRAQRLARGAMHGIDEGLEDEHLRETIEITVQRGVDSAFSAATAQSAVAQRLSEDVARAFTRGALAELRGAARSAIGAVMLPMMIAGMTLALGLAGAFVLRRARR